MLYVFFCIPVVTIGPATAGFTKIMRNFAREEHAFLWGDFIETFKKNFKQAFLFSVIDLLVYGFLILDFFALQAVTNRLMMIISMAAIFLTLTVWTFMHYYIYSMMITFDLTLRQLLKNAFIFCWAGFIRNLCLTVILVLVTVLAVQYLNILFLLFLVVTLYFSFCGFLINFMVNPLIKKHMIDGYDPQTGERLEKEKYEGFEDYEKDELDEE